MSNEAKNINTDKAPSAVGPYSQAVQLHEIVFCSGQVPICPETGKVIGSNLGEQTRQALRNLQAVLEATGSKLSRVLKTTVYITDMSQVADMNAAYEEFFTDNPPARSVVEVKSLPKSAMIEVEAIAYI